MRSWGFEFIFSNPDDSFSCEIRLKNEINVLNLWMLRISIGMVVRVSHRIVASKSAAVGRMCTNAYGYAGNCEYKRWSCAHPDYIPDYKNY